MDDFMVQFIPFVFSAVDSFLRSESVFPFTALFLLLAVIKVALSLLSSGSRVR